MQGTGERLEVEVGGLALDRPGVRVDVERRAGAIGVGHAGVEGEVRAIWLAQRAHDHVRFGLLQGVEYLLVTQAFGAVVGLAGAHVGVGQPDDFLADHGEHAGEADDQHEEPDRQGEPAMDQEPQLGLGFFR
ncbi:hypothetical protein D3C76_1131820 [compost metagenome]